MADGQSRPASHLDRVFYRPSLARVVSVEPMTEMEKVFELELESGKPLGHQPGQFVQILVMGYGEAPISVCSPPGKKTFHLCVRSVGTVSHAIHELQPGDWVGIRGPYGKGFRVEEMHGRDLLLVAGGIGIAPLRSLIAHAVEHHDRFGRIIVVYGSRNPATILFRDDLTAWESDPNVDLYVIVDQADETWKGRTGVVTLPIRDLEFNGDSRPVASVVGPPVMYKFVAAELFNKGFEQDQIYFSLERRFRCGIGKCGHCQLNDLYVCQDGPVFQFGQLVGRSEALEAWAPDRSKG